jgi:hypothetical protein
VDSGAGAALAVEGRIPSPVMVWTPEQTGRLLDCAVHDRWYPLYRLIAHVGLRHGAATLALADGVDMKVMQAMLKRLVDCRDRKGRTTET